MSKFINKSAEQQAIANGVKAEFTSGDATRVKNASLATTDYLRIRLREDGLFRKIITPKPVNESNLDRQVQDDYPCTIMDIEGKSAGAVTVPFGALPQSAPIKANRFMVVYQKLTTKRYEMDTVRMLTWNMDLRDMFYDLMLKDIMDEEDDKLFAVVNDVIGVKDQFFAETGAKRWMDCGAFGREAFAFFNKALRSNNCNLIPGIYVMNSITAQDFIGLDRTEAGGDFAQQSLFGTVNIDNISNGTKMVTTIKKNLVPNDNIFQFAPEEYLGVFFVLKDVTMITDLKEDSLLNFSAYEYVGATLENVAAMARGTFAGSAPTSNWDVDDSSNSSSL